MAENYTPQFVGTFVNDTTAVATVNANFAAISTAFSDVLSRAGVQPNQMGSTLDLNGNQIINLPAPATLNSPARLQDVTNAQNITIVTALTGTSGHTVPFLDGTNTWSGVQTFGALGGIVVSNSGVQVNNINPASFLTSNDFNTFSIQTDNLDASGLGNTANGCLFVHQFGGATTKGARIGFNALARLSAPTSGSNTNPFYTCGQFQAECVGGDGGGIGTEKGSIFAINPVAVLDSTATHMVEATGIETNMACSSTASVLDKFGNKIVQGSTDGITGSRNDAAIFFGNQSGAIGWKNLIQIGSTVTYVNPLQSTGSILACQGNPTFANGIILTGTTITGNAFASPGFSVSGLSGQITSGFAGFASGSLVLNGTTSGAINYSVNSTGTLGVFSQPIQVGVIGTTAGQINIAGATSGSAQLTCSATGSILQLGANNMQIDTAGNMSTSASTRVRNNVTPPSGGDATAAYYMSNVTGFGIYYGLGAPTISASQGSLYLRTDGNSGTTRAYINTNGSTTWTAIDTVA